MKFEKVLGQDYIACNPDIVNPFDLAMEMFSVQDISYESFKTIDTLYYETACGSGSLATAIYKCYAEGTEKLLDNIEIAAAETILEQEKDADASQGDNR